MPEYSLQYVAYDLGVSKPTLRKWITKGLLDGPGPRCGRSCRYSRDFLLRARAVRAAYDHWPHGPAANIRDYVERQLL